MPRLLTIIAGLGAGIALVVAATALGASAKSATVSIRHQVRGCHSWSVNGGPYRASQTVHVARGATITVVDNDVMPHMLVQTSGPAVRFTGKPAMAHMGASVKVGFARAGVYRFTTKVGEDYMKGVKTIGEDNVLRLVVTVG
jgi:plastocyanin